MKLGYCKFFVITFISLLIIVIPALSQVAPYKATIIGDFRNGTVNSIVQASTSNELADQVYSTIRPPGNPQPEINILLGTISLSKLQESLRVKGVLGKYFEYDKTASNFSGKDPWKTIDISLVRSSNTVYGVALSKNSYKETIPTSFKVTKTNNGNPLLRFEQSSISLIDAIQVRYVVESGNSGIKLDWFQEYLKKDSRLIMISAQEFTTCKNTPQIMQRGTNCTDFLIKLSRQ